MNQEAPMECLIFKYGFETALTLEFILKPQNCGPTEGRSFTFYKIGCSP